MMLLSLRIYSVLFDVNPLLLLLDIFQPSTNTRFNLIRYGSLNAALSRCEIHSLQVTSLLAREGF
jgi:hypothetical protein